MLTALGGARGSGLRGLPRWARAAYSTDDTTTKGSEGLQKYLNPSGIPDVYWGLLSLGLIAYSVVPWLAPNFLREKKASTQEPAAAGAYTRPLFSST